MAIDELVRQAREAVSDFGIALHCVAGYVQGPSVREPVSHDEVVVVGLGVPAAGRLGALVESLAARPGPLGIAARLAKYNLASRRVARALKANRELTNIFCRADVIVSADPEADRAVWKLRRRTDARLMHGPFAMANALSEAARG
ncbi:hypothetical protein [Arthrobacter sp. STN4]|uniref:hypothetical protein n=1 Tax=Arthrobacter sp. STN4 TaxID=2923276 RepID=UPI00211A4200|nr:hypothetical protein [Arthrobacter sp. STN4]MCQ9163017.1 hypothetical protein [Arthrobacter sp. STN4]